MRRSGLAWALCAALAVSGGTASGQEPTAKPPSAQAGRGTTLPPGHPGDAQDARFFTPPPDTAADDPALPAGVLVVTIQDPESKPVPRAPMSLSIVHSSVAKGESRERVAKMAGEDGSVRLEGLAVGSEHRYRVSTTRGAATYLSAPFRLGDDAGKRVVLHAYPTSAKLDDLVVGLQGIVYLALREDVILVEQLISVFNLGSVAWTPDLSFKLPDGFQGFVVQDATGDGRIEEVPRVGAALRGTFPPGRTDLDFRYQVPLTNEATQTLTLRMPPRVAVARVMAEASKQMGLSVGGFPEATRTESRDGKRLLTTERESARAEGGVGELAILLTGLPTRGVGRWVGLLAALLTMAAGVYYAAATREGAMDDEARSELEEAREALLDELVELERAHRSGEVGPKTYARVRASLLDALARIVSMRRDAQPRPAQRPRRVTSR